MSEEKVALIYTCITLIIYAASQLFENYALLLNDINIHLFIVVLFIYGIYFIISTVQNSQSFRRVYREVDFIKLFGNFGKILNILIGILCIVMSIIVFVIYHDVI